MSYSSGNSLDRMRQRVPCIPGKTYTFNIWARRPTGDLLSGSSAGTRAQMKFLDINGSTLQTSNGSPVVNLTNNWTLAEVTAAAPSNAVAVEVKIGVSGGGGGFYSYAPQLTETANTIDYINTSETEYAPQTMTISETIPTSSDSGGILYIDTEKYVAYQRTFSGLADALNWLPATGLISGQWPLLLPGTNHIRFSKPSSSTGQWPVRISIQDESLI